MTKSASATSLPRTDFSQGPQGAEDCKHHCYGSESPLSGTYSNSRLVGTTIVGRESFDTQATPLLDLHIDRWEQAPRNFGER